MLLALVVSTALAGGVTVEERSAGQISADLAAGRTTSEAVTRAYLDRIAAAVTARMALD